ncbi:MULTISPECIES: hypothetical protein [Pseudoalteromonas]|uniref:Uncharacterized protein n=1 Tax=Pseudoalteromonas obscura TaxID=3048491 RepID=A0ABT7EIS6_9GAMM|nr:MULTISPECIES: hypothetical protein [Pseudoalteromonas]MBQ4838373.1 hypothetical protein [Pseudoalteromonas luteoviolacea]MDK2594935.1 hypothetical protein [Pseudoalteromonas sp. P94(2023)]
MKMIANKQCRLITGGSGLLGPADPFSEERNSQREALVANNKAGQKKPSQYP